MFVIKNVRENGWIVLRCLLFLFYCFTFGENLVVDAGNALEGNPNIYWTADGMAFTTDKGELDYVSYSVGTTVIVGERRTRTPTEGEHYYLPKDSDDIFISQWMVSSPGRCIHLELATEYHGEVFYKYPCGAPYKCGWFATCADCGEEIYSLFYMDMETAMSISKLPGGKSYYYGCPTCGHLEMGAQISHICNHISANKYRISYRKNARDAEGYMDSSVFYYNNATEYEGGYVQGETRLKECGFERPGYVLAGWNTMPDGSGQSFRDCQFIYNLSSQQNDEIVLYAQWKRPDSTLIIDPAGGSYEGRTIKIVTKGYGEQIRISMGNIGCPIGYRVSFNTGEQCEVDPILSKMIFDSFCCSTPFYGTFVDDTYFFTSLAKTVDRIKLQYRPQAIVLPQAYSEGYRFEGWFLDEQGLNKVGNAGDLYTPTKNITLFAKWSEQIGVTASLSRILEPHAPIFACGESGYVDMQTWGHIERLEVYFPEEFLKYNPEMNHVYQYDAPEKQKKERLQFMVPLKTPQNSEYTITVLAYKDGCLTEDSPVYLPLQVKGSILDELRTRLR